MINTKSGYKKRRLQPTKFERLWGMDVYDLAETEFTTSDAIHMRVMRFGTPFMRKIRPNTFEAVSGRSHTELCERLGLNRKTVFSRFMQKGDPFFEPKHVWGKADIHFVDGVDNHPKYGFWLHPRHPNYYPERARWIPFLKKLDPTGERKLIELYGDL